MSCAGPQACYRTVARTLAKESALGSGPHIHKGEAAHHSRLHPEISYLIVDVLQKENERASRRRMLTLPVAAASMLHVHLVHPGQNIWTVSALMKL